MAVYLLGAVIAVVVIIGAIYSYKKNQERMAALANLARAKGWTYDQHDRFNLPDRWDEHPFGKGHSRRASNVLTGTVNGHAFVGFDYRFTETTHDSDGDRHDQTYHFQVCVLRLPVMLPRLQLTPENVMSRIGNALGMDDIELELEDFNRRFRVKCPDRKFATDVLHPRTMEQLLRTEAWCYRIDGSDLLCYESGRAQPSDVLAHLSQMQALLAGIPAFVWKDRGYDPQATTG